jgi:WD40 repeat protein
VRPLLLLVPVALAAVAPSAVPADPVPVLTLRGEFGGGDVTGATFPVFSRDGKTVYAATSGATAGRVLVIDPAAGAPTGALAAPKLGDAVPAGATGLALSPDGRWLAVAFALAPIDPAVRPAEAGWDLQLWDLSTRTLAARQRGARWTVGLLAFSPDGKHLAGATTGYAKEIDWYQASALVWDVPGLARRHAFTRRGHGYSAVGFATEDGTAVLRVMDAQTIRVWDVATGKEAEPRPVPGGTAQLAAFSPDGKTLATASEVTDPSTGRRLATQVYLHDAVQGGKAWAVARGHTAESDRLVFSPDGRFLATTSSRAPGTVVWDAENLDIQAEIASYGQPAFAPDGRTLTLSGTGYWSVPGGRHLFTVGRQPTQIWSVAFHPQGWQVACGPNTPTVSVYDPATRKNTLNVPLDPNGRTIRSVAYDRTGLALAAVDGATVKLIKPDDGYVYATLKGHTSGVNAVAVSPGGKHLATAGGSVRWRMDEPVPDAGEVIIWWWERGGEAKVVHTLKGHPSGCFALAWSPDGKGLATGGGEPNGLLVPAAEGPAKDAVKLWDSATGKQVRAFPCDPRHHVNALAWSPDGKFLAHTGIDGTRVRVLDPATGAEKALLSTPTEGLAFSPDGGLLAAVGAGGRMNGEGLIELWDTATWRKAASVVGHARPVHAAAFGPEGKSLATGSDDGVLLLWDVRR